MNQYWVIKRYNKLAQEYLLIIKDDYTLSNHPWQGNETPYTATKFKNQNDIFNWFHTIMNGLIYPTHIKEGIMATYPKIYYRKIIFCIRND